jgi:hypothetical protein
LGVGAEYGYGQMDLEASGTVAEVTGSLDTSWTQHFKMDNLKNNMAFERSRTVWMDTWDIFARCHGCQEHHRPLALQLGRGGGAILMAARTSLWGVWDPRYASQIGSLELRGCSSRGFRGDSDFHHTDPWPDESWAGKAKLHYWQAQASLAATFQADTWRFWVGPFVQYTQGDMDFSGTTSIAGLTGTINWSSTIDDSFQVGGHFGANWKVSDQFNLWLEGQIASDSWLVGVGLVLVPEKPFGI